MAQWNQSVPITGGLDNYDGGMRNWQMKSPQSSVLGAYSPLLKVSGMQGKTLQDLQGYGVLPTLNGNTNIQTEQLQNPQGATVGSLSAPYHPSWQSADYKSLGSFLLGAAGGAYAGMTGAGTGAASTTGAMGGGDAMQAYGAMDAGYGAIPDIGTTGATGGTLSAADAGMYGNLPDGMSFQNVSAVPQSSGGLSYENAGLSGSPGYTSGTTPMATDTSGRWISGLNNGQTAQLGLGLLGLGMNAANKPGTPPAPDYTAAANAQAAAGRVNQFTPYGSQVYSQSGVDSQGNPIWNQTQTLAPAQQQLLDAQNQTSLGLAGLQGKGLTAVGNMFGNLPSASQLPASPINPGQTAQDAIMSRLQPMQQQQNAAFDQQMANQGIQPGTEAYDNAKRSLSWQQNDQNTQAALTGINTGFQARQQGMNEQGFYSQLPLNLLNALRTGSQVQSPTFGATPQAPNYVGAAQLTGQNGWNTYNAQTGSYNNTMNGLFGLAGAALTQPKGP